MRIIDWKVLKTMVPYSCQHIQRLEHQGLFPRRRQLGQHRVGWMYDEVVEWIQSRPRPH
jgi:prophage regulatory protein